MAKDLYQISLKAILRRADGKILGLNGRRGSALEGFYDLPGGRIEQEEFTVPFHDILLREIQEEIGCQIHISLQETPVALGRHASRDGIHVLYIFFEGTIEEDGGSYKISQEHEGFAWLDVSRMTLDKDFNIGILEGMRQWCAQAEISA